MHRVNSGRRYADTRLLIVGYNQPGHMGAYLARAASFLEIPHQVIDVSDAEARTRIGRFLLWRYGGKKPGRIRSFGDRVIRSCRQTQSNLVLTTGIAPLEQRHVEALRASGAKMINYSTDDPWNPNLRAPWFLSALSSYDTVFTPRRSNMEEFHRAGARSVHYLPFGYDQEVHRPLRPDEPSGAPSDLLFVGGCDEDRLPLISSLIDADLNLALFGGYWDRHAKTKRYWRGMAGQATIRAASASTRVCLCLVRRANRDEHVMRSFEIAAMGGCVLAEDTVDHRHLFGKGARYFGSPASLVREARDLVESEQTRDALANELRRAMAKFGHSYTYASRLSSMIEETLGASAPI
jgi:spore maturation protein CgeB